MKCMKEEEEQLFKEIEKLGQHTVDGSQVLEEWAEKKETEESNFKHKPDPDIVNYIMSQVNVDKGDTVIIGDSKSDILTGHNAGIDTIAVTYGYDSKENLINANPSSIIDDFSKLQEIIEINK